MKKRLLIVAAVASITGVFAGDLPWDGTKLVFGEAYRDTTNELEEAASATEVRFGVPATLVGEALTLLAPAAIAGERGAVLNPLAGTDGLRVGPAYEAPTFYGSLTRQLLWRGVSLADVSSVAGCLCGSWGGNGKSLPDYIFFDKADDSLSATVQFQAWQIEQWTRTVLLQLEQDGDDVYATLVWAKYSSARSSNGQDWLKNPAAAEAGDHGEYTQIAVSDGAAGISVTAVVPVFDGEIALSGSFPEGTVTENVRRILVTPQTNLSVDRAFAGSVREVVYRNTRGDWQTYESKDSWVGTDEVLVSDDATVGSVEVIGAFFCGTAVNADCYANPELFDNVGVWSDTQGAVRKMQVQYHDDGGAGNNWTKAVNLEFRQDGRKVWMKAVSTCYQSGDVRGTHIAETDTLPCTSGSPSDRGACNSGYGFYGLTLRYRSGDWSLSFDGSARNAIARGARFVLDGVGSASCKNDHAFPCGCTLALTNGTRLTLSGGTGMFDSNGSTLADSFVYSVAPGCQLQTTGDWEIGAQAHLEIAGGRFVANRVTYANWITLSDGGSVETGGSGLIRVGCHSGDTFLRTLPGSDDTVDAMLVGLKRTVNGYRNVHAFDLGADLHVKRPIADCLETAYFGLNWEKTGPATLYLEADASTWAFPSATASAKGAFDICAGTLACRADHVLSGENPIGLKGGTLDAGTHENAFGTLTVTSDSAIALDDGARLTFADSSAAEWSGKLAITGPWDRLEAGHVRFGTSADGLTAEQLRGIRYNGKCRARIDENGWLTAEPAGLMLILR